MSGTGSRFAAKGYKEIKPLVQVFGKAIIQYIVEKFSMNDRFIFICREEHLANRDLNLKNYLKTLAPNSNIISVENHKLGPVYSLMQIEKYIKDEKEIIVNYCDFDWRWDYNVFKKWISTEKPDAALCVYSGFHPHYINPAPYAYTRNDQHNILEIKEKESFTKYREEETAASGTFYFCSGELLLDACKWLFKKGDTINGEFYVSLLFNYFPTKNKRSLIYSIRYFMQWGTPQDLEEFIFFAKKVPLNLKMNFLNFPILTLMAGKGKRMKSIDKVKKPYIGINNLTLFEICTKNIKSKIANIYALNGDKEDRAFINRFPADSNNIFVGDTYSSIETLSQSINKVNLPDDNNILISPCDASIDLDWNDLLEKYKNYKDFDAIIFTFSGYPYAKWMPDQYGWLSVNKDNSVKEIHYKKGWDKDFLNPIITGYFFFPNIGKLKNDLKVFQESLNKTQNEVSIDEFCQFLIDSNNKVISYQVDDFLCLGTPLEFRTYEYFLEANEISKIN